MNRRVIFSVVSLTSLLTLIVVNFGFISPNNKVINKTVDASGGSVTINNQTEWGQGSATNTNISADPNSAITIDNKTVVYTDISGAITIDLHAPGGSELGPFYYDLGQEYVGISRVDLSSTHCPGISFSVDNVNWSGEEVICGGENELLLSYTARYIKLSIDCSGPPETTCHYDFARVFQAIASATHTSFPTQLDSGEHDTVSWTTFAPSGTIPANTAVSFRFRTSDDASTWSAWSSSTPYAASIDLSGLTQQRYLQVETTLSNTDGTNTPVLDSYTANYDYTDAPVPTCEDGVQNGEETGVDCGGSCGACPVEPTCIDGIQNGSETGVDCGGSCSACPVEPTCEDGVQNGEETGVDCGGSCGACPVEPTCIDGIQNGSETGVDCGGSCGACTPDEPDPTCNDGAMNGGETGVDCGGSCGACPVEPTCIDGIQNGSETGVDCGGSCGACPKQCHLNECRDQALADISSCQSRLAANDLEGYAECESRYCSAIRSCHVSCGIDGGKTQFIDVLQPNGGESFNINENIAIKWFFTDSDRRTRITESNIALTLSLSLDGGATYNPIRTLIPSGNTASPLVKQELATGNPVEIGTYQIDTVNKAYSYTWTPGLLSFITDKARIKLTPHTFNCLIKMDSDSSDNDFRIWTGSRQLTLRLDPVTGEGHPGELLKFHVHAILSNGSDVTADTSFSYVTSTAAEISSSSSNEVELKIGNDIGFKDRTLLVTGRYQELSASTYASINVLADQSPSQTDPPECGLICSVVGTIKSFIDKTAADETKRNLISLIGLLVGLINLTLSSLAMAKDMIAPFIKGKDKKATLSYIYDAATGLPVAKAKILLVNLELGNLAGMTLSGKDGHYALDLSPHKRYAIKVEAKGYELVSKSLHQFDEAGLPFNNNYFGEDFIAEDNQLNFTKNLPLRLVDSASIANRLKRKEKLNGWLIAINIPLLFFGSGTSLIILAKYPILFNFLICALYFLAFCFFLLRNLILEGKGSGVVSDISESRNPVDLALIRAIRIKDRKLIHTVLSDHSGRYSLTLPKGIYDVYASKTGLIQNQNLSVVIRSSFRPSVNDIEMRSATELKEESVAAESDNAVIPAILQPETATIPIANETSANSAGEVIERYRPSSEGPTADSNY